MSSLIKCVLVTKRFEKQGNKDYLSSVSSKWSFVWFIDFTLQTLRDKTMCLSQFNCPFSKYWIAYVDWNVYSKNNVNKAMVVVSSRFYWQGRRYSKLKLLQTFTTMKRRVLFSSLTLTVVNAYDNLHFEYR